MRGRTVATGLGLGLGLVLAAGCGEEPPAESGQAEVEAEAPVGDGGPGDGPAADEHTSDGAATDGRDDDDGPEDSPGDAATEEADREAPAAGDQCPRIDWREQEGGSFEGSLDPAPEPSDDPGEWVVDAHGPVALAVPGTWAPAAENQAQPEVWGYDAAFGEDGAEVFVTGICGNPIIGVDGGPLDLEDPVRSGGLDAMLGAPDAAEEGPDAYTALWRGVWDGLMSMRYDFVAVDDVVVVLISQAVEPDIDALDGEHADVMDAVVDSVGSPGQVDCPPMATTCVDQRGG